MAEAYSGMLRGVGIQTMVRLKPMRANQKEDLKISGNKITLLDINHRLRDEAEVYEVFPSHINNSQIYETQLQNFVPIAIQGLNIGICTMGSTGSGKTYTFEGSKTEQGVVPLFVDGLFGALADKEAAAEGGSYSYTVRMQFVEIVNEEISDLLGKGGKGALPMKAELNEWEGAAVVGAERRVISNFQQFFDMYAIGLQNKTTLANEFGKLSDKAASLLTIEIIQITELGGDTQVLANKVTFADLPGLEILSQDPESLQLKQGATLNHGVLSLQDIIIDLATGKSDVINYDSSELTKACADIFGGNAVTLAIFNLQYDDQIGSGVTLKLLRQCQRIINFPIANDNRAICLLHKYRREVSSLRKSLYGTGGETIEQYQLKIAELEKRLISENLESIKFTDEKKSIGMRMQDLREKYNAMVKEKADLQGQLLESEEEKLSLSKGYIELQIENAKLNEQISNLKYEDSAKGLHEEAIGRVGVIPLKNALY